MARFSLADLLLKKYGVLDPASGCINCKNVPKMHGYSYISIMGGQIKAHRAAYAAAHGEIPDGYVVRHKCDNRRCMNPEHLVLGTHLDNMADMKSRGRSNAGKPLLPNQGGRNKMAKLDEASVIAIRNRAESGETHTSIAIAYGLSIRHVGNIVARNRWTHI